MTTIIIITCLVNFTAFKYNRNIVNNYEFNVLSCVILVQGLLNLIFLIDLNVLKRGMAKPSFVCERARKMGPRAPIEMRFCMVGANVI